MRVALHSASDPLPQTDNWFVAQVLFGPVTAVVVVCSSQSHSHGREGGFEEHKRTQDPGQQPEEQCQSVHKPVGEVKAWSGVAQTHQHIRHEVPKADWLVIGYVIRLKEKRREHD